ncbi:MAG: DUF3667 domain-containing protein [Paraglaciecola sp.]|uniref:DUF3667 domain-containing protein n=1 Tax=Paraglaciecola sp. TaxID=1920173 RepID=UPI003296B0DF
MQSFTCQNCGATVEANFCGQCGQKKQERITLGQVGEDVYSGLFDFESPFLKTLYFLTINPSKVYVEYLEGARKRYFSPVRYSIWIMTLMVAIGAITDTVLVDLSQLESNTPELENQLIRFQAIVNSLLIPLYFMSACLTAGFLRLIFRNEKYTFAELFYPVLLNISHFCLVFCLAILLGVFQNVWCQLLLTVLSVVYMCWGLTGIFRPVSPRKYLKSLFAIVLGLTVYMLVFAFLSFLIGYSSLL